MHSYIEKIVKGKEKHCETKRSTVYETQQCVNMFLELQIQST